MAKERLDKILAAQTAFSRKEVKELVRRGIVQVDGRKVLSPEEKVDAACQKIVLDGKPLGYKKFVYLMLNKPQGVVSATRDRETKTVLDLVPEQYSHRELFPAGRLDKDTVGFLLLTDDGNFAHDILSPRHHIPKTYLATVDGPITQELMEAFHQGLPIGGEDRCSPAEITVLNDGEHPTAEVVIYEGMYHQIKRMFQRFGLTVLTLKRIKMGGLKLDPALSLGECRELTPEELLQLKNGSKGTV